VHHDAMVLASPGSGGPAHGPAIASLTFSELRRETFGGGDIPTLEETLAFVDGRVTLYLELKAPGLERAVLSELTHHEGAPVAIHAFDHRCSRHVRALAPALETGILSSSYLLEPGRALTTAMARDYWQWWELIDAPLVEAVHEAGGRVIAWTVNSHAACRRLHALGVDAVCTDVSDEMVPLVREWSLADG
jgi:glycerophosphoryl diester phosphodiesterase